MVLFDLGISSIQIGTPERGFLSRRTAPWTCGWIAWMSVGKGAGDIINTAGMRELISLFRNMAKTLCRTNSAGNNKVQESSGPIKAPRNWFQVIGTPFRHQSEKMGRNPARKIFQALRIAVNDELEALDDALNQCENMATGAMMLIIVSYHSLEDRIVKKGFENGLPRQKRE